MEGRKLRTREQAGNWGVGLEREGEVAGGDLGVRGDGGHGKRVKDSEGAGGDSGHRGAPR